jgi:hypothetical protein
MRYFMAITISCEERLGILAEEWQKSVNCLVSALSRVVLGCIAKNLQTRSGAELIISHKVDETRLNEAYAGLKESKYGNLSSVNALDSKYDAF